MNKITGNDKLTRVGNAVKSLLFGQQSVWRDTIDPITWNAENNIFDNIFFGNDGIEYPFTYSGHHSSLKAYQQCPPLTSIINRKAQAHINGKTYVMNSQGKEATNMQAKLITNLFAKPNPLQSQRQFEAQQKIYMQLFGYCVVFFMKPVGFKENIDATWMWNIPPNMIDIKETNKLFYQTDLSGIIDEVVLTYKGLRTKLPIQDLYIFKDFTPSLTSIIIPESRICSLAMPINNVIGAYDARNALINTRGALGIISPESVDGIGSGIMTPETKELLQQGFRRYGIRSKQWKFIISNAAVKFSQIGFAAKDLMLNEEVTESTKEICRGYGYPDFLLGLSNSTFNNQQTAAKSLYQDTIIPESDSINEEWTNCFKAKDYNLTVTKDFSHLPVLQEDRESLGRARYYLNQGLLIEWQQDIITWNRWRELIGEDTMPGMDLFYSDLVKSGRIVPANAKQNATTGQAQTDTATAAN